MLFPSDPQLDDNGPPHDGGTALLTRFGGSSSDWVWTAVTKGDLVPFPHDGEHERFAWTPLDTELAETKAVLRPEGLREPFEGHTVSISLVPENREAERDGWVLTQANPLAGHGGH